MSFLSGIESVFGKIDKWFKKVFTSTKWEQSAEVAITVIAPLLETVVALTAGAPAAATVAGIVSTIQNDLATAVAYLQGIATAGSPQAALQSAVSNLNGLLAAAKVTDPATQAKIDAAVTTLADEITAIINVIPKAA